MVLQPAVSSAALSQQPLFTVTSVPPNVMLMLDDSASMNRLTLTTPPAMLPTAITSPGPIGSDAAVKVNTLGYYGISGVRFYAGNNAAYDGRWRFSVADIMLRSAAFNPLAYNPAVQYMPWNNNGTRMAQSSYGGATNVATGTLTEWDMRSLPSGPTVRSKLTAPNSGVIATAGASRSWTAPTGSVNYAGFPTGAPEGADLFTGTVTFRDPNCNTTTNYGWTCPAGSAFVAPSDVCTAGNVGSPSANGTCCTATTSSPLPDTFVPDVRYIEYGNNQFPNGTPPVPTMTGPGGEVCNAINWNSDRTVNLSTGCIQDPPVVVPCAGGGGELCTVLPPLRGCDTAVRNTWRCNYTRTQTNSTPPVCTSTVARVCSVTGTPCSGYNPASTTGPAEQTGGYFTPARFFVYDGPQPGTSAERRNLSNYRAIMIDRKFGWDGATSTRPLDTSTGVANAVTKWHVVDAASGLPGYRPDCAVNAAQDGTWCTFEQEAQNYSNWYTYYRSRLFAAVGVLSEVFSGFTGPEQFIRLGFGRINYFPGALNPWNVNSITDIPNPVSLPTVDGMVNEGAVVRGVRPFTVESPPASGTPNPDRAAFFTWLFSINGLGPTPNREAMHAVGSYFSNNTSTGPWGANPGSGTEAQSDHLWCRRNYTVLGTDGEWTRLPDTSGFRPQRLLERGGDFSNLNPLGSGSVLTSLSTTGPTITGVDRDDPTIIKTPFTHVPASEPQLTGGSGSVQTETLSDVMYYYWSRDLRAGAFPLRNSLKETTKNRAFWQHLTTYVVGYGVSASMDDPNASPSLRTTYEARGAITWPNVDMTDCRQLDDYAADMAIPNRPTCALVANSAGNRINDTLRASLATGGDFFSANSPGQLRNAMDSVFKAINAEPSSGTAPALSSGSIAAGNLVVASSFRTDVWDGKVEAFDQVALVDHLVNGTPKPAALWTANFPAFGARNLYSSTAIDTPVAFTWAGLNAAQKGALDAVNVSNASSPVLDYLRGDQSREQRFPGGIYRTRLDTILGDIVNSTPIYSKATDFAYQFQPAGSKTLPLVSTQGYNTYRAYVTAKQTTRNPIVVTGSNGGMLHILDARTGVATKGSEIFGFVPRAIVPAMVGLTEPAFTHRYYVDGPVIEGDVWNGTAWKTIAVGTTGAGPAGVFAIDITAPQSGFTGANVLWDIVPAEHADADVRNHLGNVLHSGFIGSVKDSSAANGAGRWAYVVGNGYESVNQEATLMIFDAFSGALIKAIKTGVGGALTPNGLGAITPVFDGARNIVAVVAGDKLGNLWKFDLSSSTINDPDGVGPLKGWQIFNQVAGAPVPLFTATDAANVPQPISAAPRITPHPVGGLYVAFGSGKMFEPTDPADTQVQSIYVLWDKNQVAPITKAQLQPIALQEFGVDLDANATTPDELFRRLKASDLALYDWNDRGFYLPLIKEGGTAEGERVLAAPILDAGVISFTTFAPTSGIDRCVPGGASYLYRLNLAAGLDQSGFVNITAAVGRRIQPGLVSSAPPLYDPLAPTGTTIDSMSAADVQTMMQNPKHKSVANRAVQQGATGTCAHVGLRVDGTVARIPTVCAGLMPLRSWRPVR